MTLDRNVLKRLKQREDDKRAANVGIVDPDAKQAIAFAAASQRDAAKVTLIMDALGEPFLNYPEKVDAVLFSQREVAQYSTSVFDGQVGIGRSIAALRAILEPSEYRQLLEQTRTLYGSHLSKPVVTQLIAVSQAIDKISKPEIDVDLLPKHYSVVYAFTTMTDDLYKRAKASGLVRPDVKRTEIFEWKKRATQAPLHKDTAALSWDERGRLASERQDLLEKISKIDARIAELDREISTQTVSGFEEKIGT